MSWIGGWVGRWVGRWVGGDTPTADPHWIGRANAFGLHAAGVSAALRTVAASAGLEVGGDSAALYAHAEALARFGGCHSASAALHSESAAVVLQCSAMGLQPITVGDNRVATFEVQDDLRASVDVTGYTAEVIVTNDRGRLVKGAGSGVTISGAIVTAAFEPSDWAPWLGIERDEIARVAVRLFDPSGALSTLQHGEENVLQWTLQPRP